MKIGFVCSEYPPAPHGGVGAMVQDLGHSLVERGHEVVVAGLYRQGEAVTMENDRGVEVCRLRMPRPRHGWIWARYKLYRTISNWVRQKRIDLVEVPDYEGWAAYWPALPVPMIVRLHGAYSYFAREMGRPIHRPTFWLERAGLRRADFYCSTSAYTAGKTRALFSLKRAPDAVIYNGVDVPPQNFEAGRSRHRVIFTGTLTPKKGVLPLAQAWPKVAAADPAAELHIFGKDGLTTERRSVKGAMLQQLGEAAGSVRFYGHVRREQVLEHLRTARLAVFPSFAEAFAMAPLEAMAQGCPTIYGRCGSGPELIEDGRDGLLVNPADPDEIAGSILRILRDDGLAASLGRAGRRRIEGCFSGAKFASVNEAFYKRCIQQFSAPKPGRLAAC